MEGPSYIFARDLIATVVFWGFVTSGLLLARGRGVFGMTPRFSTSLFLGFVSLVVCAVGFSQQASLFPFNRYILFGPPAVPRVRIHHDAVALDARGTEHPIDYRAWQPISYYELKNWYALRFPRLDEPARRNAARYLLERAERARRAARRGDRIGSFDRWLGRFAAPLFVTYQRSWTSPELVPTQPFVGLRLYEIRFDIDERLKNPGAVDSMLFYEYNSRP